MRRRANSLSGGVSQVNVDFVSGKSGRIDIDQTATITVRAPSTKKSHLQGGEIVNHINLNVRQTHLHPAKPPTPSNPSKAPEAINDPNALLIRLPEARYAMRWESSVRVYHFEIRN